MIEITPVIYFLGFKHSDYLTFNNITHQQPSATFQEDIDETHTCQERNAHLSRAKRTPVKDKTHTCQERNAHLSRTKRAPVKDETHTCQG